LNKQTTFFPFSYFLLSCACSLIAQLHGVSVFVHFKLNERYNLFVYQNYLISADMEEVEVIGIR